MVPTWFMILSDSETAKGILGSLVSTDRRMKESACEFLFHRAMGFAPFRAYWRSLRRISATHLFSPRGISVFGEFRRIIGLKMLDEIRASIEEEGEVNVKKVLHFESSNNVMMSVFGGRYRTVRKYMALMSLVA